MTTQNGRAFNEWLRAQLKAKKMSQRQLAQQSGVDHSTISRLIRGDRMPSLGTATKLARGLRELRDDADTPQYLGLVAAGNDEPDGPRRIRAARRRAPERAAGPPDHGVLPRRPDAPLRPSLPAAPRSSTGVRSGTGANPGADRPPRPARSGSRVRGHRQHGAPGLTHRRAGNRGVTEHTPGHDPDSPSTVRVSGTANAGVWGAGVRDSAALGAARPTRRMPSSSPGARTAAPWPCSSPRTFRSGPTPDLGPGTGPALGPGTWPDMLAPPAIWRLDGA